VFRDTGKKGREKKLPPFVSLLSFLASPAPGPAPFDLLARRISLDYKVILFFSEPKPMQKFINDKN